MLADKRCKRVDAHSKLLLSINGPALGVEGYELESAESATAGEAGGMDEVSSAWADLEDYEP